jgi:serine/threonine protein phosphatase PrpC
MTSFAASTHPGLVRKQNEDCYEANPELGLWLVADGVGGHSYGEVASAIVKMTVPQAYSAGEKLVDAVHSSHQAVLEEIAKRDENLGMGSTVVAFTLTGNAYEVAWVGDSRAYLWNGERLEQLTRDHTHVFDLVDRGEISREDAASHPERHVLTQSIGVFDDMELAPGTAQGTLEQGQQILLCSDGLTDELSDIAITAQLRGNYTTQSQVDGLINAALAAGGRDNVTVVVVGEAALAVGREVVALPAGPDTTQNIELAKPGYFAVWRKYGGTFWLAVIIFIALVIALN